MNLHEYQAKALFARYGLPVPPGSLCSTPDEAEAALATLGEGPWVVKCQVHAGGRGKAGGVQVVEDKTAIRTFAARWLGQPLVTGQTDAQGQPVRQLLVEPCTDIARELYLGAVIDRERQRIVIIASTAGGMEIERVARETPHLIHQAELDLLTGPQPYQGRELAFQLGLQGEQVKQFTAIFLGLARLFLDKDLALVEINPLAVTRQGALICLDGKLVVDSNALFRQPELREMHDPSQGDAREEQAARWGLNYVSMDGNIGCMVNGAGLAMGTMDMIQLCGGAPANFLDVGGGTTRERVSEAFKIILADQHVRAVLINIFGGIVRCDVIAEGIIGAVADDGIAVPVIVRLEGNQAEEGRRKLAQSGLNIITAHSLTEAARLAVAAAKEGTTWRS